MTSNELLGAVLDLPTRERARIAHELLRSLDDQDDEDDQRDVIDERDLLAEIERRRQQAEAGEVRMLDRMEFEQAIARRRAARRTP